MTHKRTDGYHDIETVFYPLALRDVLEVVPAGETSLQISGLSVPGGEHSNLVWKAYELLNSEMPGKLPPMAIYLHKVIPMGAGLGGGSADGAFMLKLLNDFCKLELSKEQLAAYALQLGSDCPFFIYNKPRFANGRGEIMQDVAIDLSGYSIQLICPKVHVSTADAFGMLTPNPAGYDLNLLNDVPVEHWRSHIGNDFEVPVFSKYPGLADIKQQLYDGGALYASMSGSGSAIFGIFPKAKRSAIETGLEFTQFYVENP